MDSAKSRRERGLLRRLADVLVRRRLLSPQPFGMPGLGYQLWRIRLWPALVLASPALALCVWYSAVAVVAHVRHRAAVNEDVPLTAELFQLHLHDKLDQDWRRLTLPEPLGKTELPTYGLVLQNDALERLTQNVPPGDGKAFYVDGHLTRDGSVYPIRVRIRGRRHWHWNHPQKSWKVRVRNGGHVEGHDVFNFINTPEPMPFEEQIILDIAREQGLLAPEYHPVRVLLNRTFMGVYAYESQPDERLLRAARRMPTSIYSGNEAPVDPVTGISSLWESSEHWKKVPAGDSDKIHETIELDALLEAVNHGTPAEFGAFAERYLDLPRLAQFDALDVVFGGNNHDFDQNHKLYFDPYRGRFEPVAWNFRGAAHRAVMNRTENPLLLRLKQLPEYLALRNRIVFQWLEGVCSPSAIRTRAEKLLDELRPDQLRDPYWDAYHLLPAMGSYYRQLLRPMTRELQREAVELRLAEHGRRERFLRGLLAHPRLTVELRAAPTPVSDLEEDPTSRVFTEAVDVTIGGYAAVKVTAMRPHFPPACSPAWWTLHADSDLDDALDATVDLELATDADDRPLSLPLYPGIRLVARSVHPARGRVLTTAEPRRYRLFVTSPDCAPDGVSVSVESLVTGAPMTVAGGPAPAPVEAAGTYRACPETAPHNLPGEQSPHPWCYVTTPRGPVDFGPGEVQVPETLVFEPSQVVTIAPGTTFRLGKHASLIFRGRVDAQGTPDAPIRFLPRDQRWGGIALQGPATAGSRLRYVEFVRGTYPQCGLVHYPGMVNLHDTQDIEVDHGLFRKNHKSDDSLHVAYVLGLTLRDTVFRKTNLDAIDLEFSSATLQRITVAGTGDECVDLMGSKVVVQDSRLLACGGSAVSAGEETRVAVRNTLAAGSRIGVLAKNASVATLDGVLLHDVRIGLRLELLGELYPGKARFKGEPVYCVGCPTPFQTDGGKAKTVPSIVAQIAPGQLEPLRALLGVKDWHELDAAVAALLGGDDS